MGGHGPRGEAAIRRKPLAALGAGRRHVLLRPALPPDECLSRIEARSQPVTPLRLFQAADQSSPLFRRRGDGFLLLRPSRVFLPLRHLTGRFVPGGIELVAGPHPLVVAAMLLVLAVAAAGFVSAPFTLAAGGWYYGITGLAMLPLTARGVVDGRRDAEVLIDFVTETLDAR